MTHYYRSLMIQRLSVMDADTIAVGYTLCNGKLHDSADIFMFHRHTIQYPNSIALEFTRVSTNGFFTIRIISNNKHGSSYESRIPYRRQKLDIIRQYGTNTNKITWHGTTLVLQVPIRYTMQYRSPYGYCGPEKNENGIHQPKCIRYHSNGRKLLSHRL
jgi:hypothetical protein